MNSVAILQWRDATIPKTLNMIQFVGSTPEDHVVFGNIWLNDARNWSKSMGNELTTCRDAVYDSSIDR